MSEQAYRRRLEADLERWQAEGVIDPAAADAIRSTFRPLPPGIDTATVVAVFGGLLVGAAVLAFVAANWSEIHRPLRFLILLTGICTAYAVGGLFARRGQTWLADVSVSVSCLIFGAAIALTGQMYHLGDDFSGAMGLWSAGSMVAAALTGSRGALAVSLVAGSIWNFAGAEQMSETQLWFLLVWLVGALLAVAWNSPAARHLVAVAFLGWWVGSGWAVMIGMNELAFGLATGGALAVGAGLLLAARPREAVAQFGLTFSTHGAFAFALATVLVVSSILTSGGRASQFFVEIHAALAAVLALLAAALDRRPGTAFAALSLVLGLLTLFSWPGSETQEPWLSFAGALLSMLALVISGTVDEARPRAVAGWLGLAGVLAGITWAVQGSLLRRAVFLGIAGSIVIGMAHLLSRFRQEVRT